MKASVRVQSSMLRAIRRAGATAVREKAEMAGRSTSAALAAAVSGLPRVNAAARRHGTPGSVHNVSFTHEIHGFELPMTLTVLANGGRRDLQKMWLLNYGRSGGRRITPKNANRLKFHWDKVGKTVYAQAVTQGGFAGRQFIEAAITAGMPWPVRRRRR